MRNYQKVKPDKQDITALFVMMALTIFYAPPVETLFQEQIFQTWSSGICLGVIIGVCLLASKINRLVKE